jgi:hypothetical protein
MTVTANYRALVISRDVLHLDQPQHLQSPTHTQHGRYAIQQRMEHAVLLRSISTDLAPGRPSPTYQ